MLVSFIGYLTRLWKRNLILFLFLCLLCGYFLIKHHPLKAEEKEAEFPIKVASIAPQGFAWTDIMMEGMRDSEQKSQGRIKYLYYGGGVMGDEPDILRKMRMGQIQGGAFTIRGISQIAPEMSVIWLAYLFNDFEEVDYIRNKMFDTFGQFFEKRGFVLLSWVDVGGFAQMFSINPIHTPEELAQQKVWIWAGEALSLEFFKAMGVSPIPLPITDVISSLQTGLINFAYGTPLSCVALQWHSRINYIIKSDFAYGPAVYLMDKKFWDRLPPELQEIIISDNKKYAPQLIFRARKDDDLALLGMHRRGIKVIVLSAQQREEFRKRARPIYDQYADKLYPRWLLDETLKNLQEFRNKNCLSSK